MKFAIFYFSGTGNTWWCTEEIKKALEVKGAEVEVYSIENPVLAEKGFIENKIDESDQLLIGYPTYGSDLPLNMRKFVEKLPIVDNKRIGLFCTQASFSGDGNVYFKKDLERKGYRMQQSVQFNMTTNFNVAMAPFCFSKPASGSKLDRKKYKAQVKIEKFVKAILHEKKMINGKCFYQILIGSMQRRMFRKAEKKLPGLFKFYKEKCVNCKLCVKSCPTGNLFFNEHGELDWLSRDTCILCFRCYNFCPQNAIAFGKKIKNPDKYVRYKGPVSDLKISDIKK